MKFPIMKIKLLCIAIFCFVLCNTYAHSILAYPTPEYFVIDFANILTEVQKTELENQINELAEETTVQIAIVSVKSLEGMSASDLARKIGNKWGVGEKGLNNGVVILVKPKYLDEKGEVFISVGLGLEETITNSKAQHIVNEIMIPQFKKGKIYRGLSDGIYAIKRNVAGVSFLNFIDPISLAIFLILSIVILPFAYIKYLKNRPVPQRFQHYYTNGNYNLQSLLKQVQDIEMVNGIKYPKFKRLLQQYDMVSKHNMIKYMSFIDRNMFCYILNGRDRSTVFWEMMDPFLKFMGIYTFIVLFILSYIVGVIHGWPIAIALSIFSVVVYFLLFSILVSILEMYLYSLRKNGLYEGGISVALFTLYTQFKRNIEKKFDPATNTYRYVPMASAVAYGTSSVGFGGGSFSGGFGVGGAGGSW